MSTCADVLLDSSIRLPDGRPNTGRYRTWGFGLMHERYRIDEAGRLFEEMVLGKDGEPPGSVKQVPMHGFFTFETPDSEQHRYTARFTYGRLDGIRPGEASVWDEEHR